MTLHLSAEDLRPLIQQIVAEAMAQLSAANDSLGPDRIGYPEAEAAVLIGVQRHVLRDARLRGEIHARLVGKRYIYGRATLLAYLAGDKE